jgi:hypothetical protein
VRAVCRRGGSRWGSSKSWCRPTSFRAHRRVGCPDESIPVRAPDGDLVYVTGELLLDEKFVRDSLAEKQPAMVRSTMLHELGDLVGLDHVPDEKALMFPHAMPGVTTFARGELPGLMSLGRGPCRPGL